MEGITMMRLGISIVLAALPLAAAPVVYDIDTAHSSAQFSVRHLMISNVKGTFQKMVGQAVWDPNDLAAAKLEATIDASTVNTQEPKRDAHLRSADFLDVARFPTLSFKSKSFQK